MDAQRQDEEAAMSSMLVAAARMGGMLEQAADSAIAFGFPAETEPHLRVAANEIRAGLQVVGVNIVREPERTGKIDVGPEGRAMARKMIREVILICIDMFESLVRLIRHMGLSPEACARFEAAAEALDRVRVTLGAPVSAGGLVVDEAVEAEPGA